MNDGPVRVPTYMESMTEIRHRLDTGRPAPRPTVYQGVSFRSRLEVAYAIHLTGSGIAWTFEPRVFGPRGRRYLPDFELLDCDRPTFVEVKPTVAEAPAAQKKMSVIWDTHPDAVLIVVCKEGCTFYAARLGHPWESWTERWT